MNFLLKYSKCEPILHVVDESKQRGSVQTAPRVSFSSCFLSPSLYVLMNVLHVVRCVINLDSLLFLTLHEQHQCKVLTSLISYSYSFFFSCSLTVKLKLFKDLYLFKSFLSRNFLTCEVRKNVLLIRE